MSCHQENDRWCISRSSMSGKYQGLSKEISSTSGSAWSISMSVTGTEATMRLISAKSKMIEVDGDSVS
jgi:hypothetical protein